MKPLFFFLIVCSVLACQNDSATAQTDGPVVGVVDPKARLVQGPDHEPGMSNLILRMGEATVAPNAVACLPVEASNFKDLLGYQYTMAYDSAALEFQSVRALNLPGYTTGNFGTRFADRGVVSTLWTEPGLKPTSFPDGRRLFEICFVNRMPAGKETTVRFQDGPTYIEVIRANMQKSSLAYANGKVISR